MPCCCCRGSLRRHKQYFLLRARLRLLVIDDFSLALVCFRGQERRVEDLSVERTAIQLGPAAGSFEAVDGNLACTLRKLEADQLFAAI